MLAIFIVAFQNRTSEHRITITNSDGSEAELAADDAIRVKIGGSKLVPLLDIRSGSNLPGGSYVTKSNPCTLELVAADLTPQIIQPGTYDIEVGVIDSTDSDRFKQADQGVFTLISTQQGGTS